jgi:hypothetical protein
VVSGTVGTGVAVGGAVAAGATIGFGDGSVGTGVAVGGAVAAGATIGFGDGSVALDDLDIHALGTMSPTAKARTGAARMTIHHLPFLTLPFGAEYPIDSKQLGQTPSCGRTNSPQFPH